MTEITIRGWHRTESECVDSILAEGFNLGRTSHGRVWGDGTYLALHPDTLDIYSGDSLVTASITLPAHRVAYVSRAEVEEEGARERVKEGLASRTFDAAVIDAAPLDWGPGGFQIVVRPYLLCVEAVDGYDNCAEELEEEELGVAEWYSALLCEGQRL